MQKNVKIVIKKNCAGGCLMRVKRFKWEKWMEEILLLNIFLLAIITAVFLFFTGKRGASCSFAVIIVGNLIYYSKCRGVLKKQEDKKKEQEKNEQGKQKAILDKKIEACKEFQDKFKELNEYIESKKQEENGNLEITELGKRKDKILKLLVQLPEINDYDRMRNRTEIKKRHVSEIVDQIYYDVLECTDKTRSLEYCYCIMRNCYSDIILTAGTWQGIWEKKKDEIEGEVGR